MELKYVLFIISSIIIFSYLFDAIARKTKFPSVILLMATGIGARAFSDYLGYEIAYLDQIIPVMGTIGLLLIVLEGALELEVRKEKLSIILRGFMSALVILLGSVIGLTLFFQHGLGMGGRVAVMNAIPLGIISSAVAIPSAAALMPIDKEFVVYESTFSDILGIMLFNYALRQFETPEGVLIGFQPIAILLLEIAGIVVASIFVTWFLFELFERIDQKVKFFLILGLLIFVYAVGKTFHLPSLVIIFIFGIFLANSNYLLPDFIKKYISMSMAEEEGLHEFHILTAESTFLVRTFFFLFFGFSIPLSSFADGYNYMYGGIILGIMFLIRLVYMFAAERKSVGSLVFVSPRGLISILLFIQLQTALNGAFKSEVINEKVLLIVILGSMLIMTIGTVIFGGKNKEEDKGGTDNGKIGDDNPVVEAVAGTIQDNGIDITK